MQIKKIIVFLASILFCQFLSASSLPEIHKWETAKGAKVMFVQSSALPMVDVRVVFDAGSARDNESSGLALLTNEMLFEGAGGLSSQEIAERFESVGAQFESDSVRDMAYIGVRSLVDRDYLNLVVETLALVLGKPDFNQGEFERELARMKVTVKAKEQSPSDLAEDALYQALYRDHPYASPVVGTAESLDKLTVLDVTAFYRQFYVSSNAVVAIVGDLTREQASDLVEKIFRFVDVGEKPEAIPAVSALKTAQDIRIPYPSSQSHILLGQPGMKRNDVDFFPLYVANHIFGGSGFSTRLVESIREERGLAYSVYSYFLPMRETGPFIIGMQTKTEQQEEALALVKSELDKYLVDGPNKKEIEESVSNITGGYPLNFDSNKKLTDYLSVMGFYNYPDDYLETYVANIKKVNKDQINNVIKERISSEKIITVIVGNDVEAGTESVVK